PGEHVAARRIDSGGSAADDGGFQQPRRLRPERAAKQHGLDHPGTRDRLVDGRGRQQLIFPLRQGVKWHDGKPFTAADVKCTWDLLAGKPNEKLRINPRKSWYGNIEEVIPNGDFQVTFRLKRPQPALLALLASGWAPIYPCHVSPRDMRTHPIGTGPFKF